MKVLLINGSPHTKGCTATALGNVAFLVRAIAAERERRGLPEVDAVRVNTNFIR